MPTIVNFKGKKVVEPGVYSQIKSGIPAKTNNFYISLKNYFIEITMINNNFLM